MYIIIVCEIVCCSLFTCTMMYMYMYVCMCTLVHLLQGCYVCHCDRLDDLFVVDMQFVTGYENPTIVYIAEVGTPCTILQYM